jgi:hypothetical protein
MVALHAKRMIESYWHCREFKNIIIFANEHRTTAFDAIGMMVARGRWFLEREDHRTTALDMIVLCHTRW